MSQTFDHVVAYSVFTNTLRSDRLELVEELRLQLNPGNAQVLSPVNDEMQHCCIIRK